MTVPVEGAKELEPEFITPAQLVTRFDSIGRRVERLWEDRLSKRRWPYRSDRIEDSFILPSGEPISLCWDPGLIVRRPEEKYYQIISGQIITHPKDSDKSVWYDFGRRIVNDFTEPTFPIIRTHEDKYDGNGRHWLEDKDLSEDLEVLQMIERILTVIETAVDAREQSPIEVIPTQARPNFTQEVLGRLAGINIPEDAIDFLSSIERGESDGVSCWRSPKVKIYEHSSIEGRGLVASQEIDENELLAIKTGHIIDENGVRSLLPILKGSQQQIGPDEYLAGVTEDEVGKNLVGYNHSCDPSAKVIFVEGAPLAFLVSRRRIHPNDGDEITTDYSVTDDSETRVIEDCKCGKKLCRHTINPPQDWRRRELQERYKGEFPWYMQQLIDLSKAE